MFYIYANQNIFRYLQDPLDEIPSSGDFTLEVIDMPLTVEVNVSERNINVTTLYRDRMRNYIDKVGSVIFTKKGNTLADEGIQIKCEDENKKTMTSYWAMAALEALKRVEVMGMLSTAETLDERTEGILIEVEYGKSDAKIVKGRHRPSLMCTAPFGKLIMCRPYEDEETANTYQKKVLNKKIEKFTKRDDPVSLQQTAMAYLAGNGVEKDFRKALEWFKKAADLGNTSSMFNLGLFYAKGCGTDRNFERAIYWMRKADVEGDEEASKIADRFECMSNLLTKANTGDAASQADLASKYIELSSSLSEMGPEKDYEEAFHWAQKSAEQKCPEGCYILGLCYEHGRGTKANSKKAAEFYQEGASFGHAPSEYNLGCCYMNGFGVAKDEKKGYQFFTKAASKGYDLSMKALGQCYQFGNGVGKDTKSAIKWYEKFLAVKYDPELKKQVEILKNTF